MKKDDNYEKFKLALEKAKQEHNIEDDSKLLEIVPKQDNQKHGPIEQVSVSGLALTASGKITRTEMLANLDIDREENYKHILLSPEEARSLAMTYRKLSTGVNSVVPMTCSGEKCPFAKTCWYFLNQKAPLGKPCLVEYDLLNYHTMQFMKEFDVKEENYSEFLLVQELAELLVYEMRATRVLSEPGNANLMGLKIKFSPDGEEIEEETIHWAWELKEKIKNKRMKILDSLMATRKNKVTIPAEAGDNTHPYVRNIADLNKKLNDVLKFAAAKEVKYSEGEDD